MTERDQFKTLKVIQKSLAANFVLAKPGDKDYKKPLRASNNKKNYLYPSLNVTYFHKKRITRSFQAEIPITMAVGIADLYGVDAINTMDCYQIDTFDEYAGKMAAFEAIIKRAVRAAINKKSKKKYDENFHRFFILYNLTMNHIRLNLPTPEKYVRIPKII